MGAVTEIVSGYNANTFGVNDPLTREQMAVILHRFNQYKNMETESAGQPPFADSDSVSDWAVQAVFWAQSKEIMNGRPGNLFDPKSNITRAEASVILLNYSSLILGKQPGTAQDSVSDLTSDTSGKVLIAYFSRTGTTETIAKQIQETVGGDLYHIVTVEPYPEVYRETTDKARIELDEDFRPALSGTVGNMDEYDVVFLGYPIWWGTTPMAVRTFLDSYDFNGKTIVPFATHEGSALGSSVTDITRQASGADVLEGLAIRNGSVGNARNEIEVWINRLGIVVNSDNTVPTSRPLTTKIQMTVGSVVISAELTDSQTTRDFLATLPNTVTLNRYGDREYYGNPGTAISTDGETIPDYENGDITYYPPSGNLAIFFGQEDTPNQSGLIRMGKITSDLLVFDSFGQTIEMTIAVVD